MLKCGSRRPFLVALIFVGIFVGIAHVEATAQVQTDEYLIWAIQTEENTAYLLGSIHILKSFPSALIEKIEKEYNDCKKIVFEVDIDSMNKEDFQNMMVALGLYPESQTLKQNISSETYNLFKNKVEGDGLKVEQFERFKPWLCSITVTAMELVRLGFNPEHGVDRYFYYKAKIDGKELIFLETPEYQLSLFAGMSDDEQESMLKQTLEDLKVVETKSSELISAWEEGAVDKLGSILKEGFKGYPEIYNRLVVQRNKKWLQQIEALIKQNENVLVIVGAGHLVGEEGLVELFRQKGYKVERR